MSIILKLGNWKYIIHPVLFFILTYMKGKTLWTMLLAGSLLLWSCWDKNEKSNQNTEDVPSELIENFDNIGEITDTHAVTTVIYPSKYDDWDRFDEEWKLITDKEFKNTENKIDSLENNEIDSLGIDSLDIDSVKIDSIAVQDTIQGCPSQGILEIQDKIRGEVFITIDDGPWPYTQEIAEELHKRWHHATFFMLGSNMNEGRYEAMRHAVNLWHEIWNHSYSHPNFRKISFDRARWELERTKSVIEKAWIKPAPYFRFPYWNSFSNEKMFDKYLKAIWYEEVFWNIDTRDWSKSTTKKDLIRCLEKTKPGDIILIHERSYTKDRTIPTMDSVLKSKWLISVPYRKK